MTALPLLLFALAPAKVTFEHEAAPVDKVLGALSKQTGLDLAVGQTPMLDVVFVKVKDADLDTLQKKIADVTSAKWIEVEGTKRLVPDTNRRQMEERFDEAEYRTLLDMSLTRFANTLKGASDSPERTFGLMGMGFFGNQTSEVLAMQCALGVGRNALQTVSRDGRVVWSTSPTAGQLALEVPGLADMVNAAVRNHNSMVDGTFESPVDDPETAERMRQMEQAFGGLFRPKRIEGKPVLVHVVCTRSTNSWRGGLELKVRAFDEAGNEVLSSATTLGSAYENGPAQQGMSVPDEPSSSVEEQAPLQEMPSDPAMWEFSERALEWQRLVQNGGWGVTKDPRTRELILAIGERDPLSYGASEALSHYADKVERNIVASIPDSAAGVLDRATNVAEVEAAWANDQPLKMTEADGWIAISSRQPSFTRGSQTDRAALARLFASASPEGTVPLDVWADYAVDNPDPRTNYLVSSLVRLMTRSSEPMFEEGDKWLALRLYGTLTATQRKGAAVPAGIWSQTQRQTVAKWVYGPEPELVASMDAAFIDRVMQEMPFGSTSSGSPLSLEPTQVAPGGVGPNTAIIVSRANDKCYAAVGAVDGGFPGIVGYEEMALLRALMMDDEVRQAIERDQQLPRQFRVGTRQRVKLSVQVGPAAYVVAELHDDSMDSESEVVSFEKFTEEERARIDDLAKQILKSPIGQFFKAMATMGGAFGGGREVVPPSR